VPSLRPVAAAFAVFGFFWGSWAVSALDVQRFLHFTDGELGLLLAATVLGGALANAAGGNMAERWGARPVLAVAMGGWGLMLFALPFVHNKPAFCALLAVTVAAGGLVDVVMNVSATAALGTQPGRLLRFHALFNGGAVVGAAMTGIVVSNGGSWRYIWGLIGVLAGSLALWISRSVLPAGERGERYTLREGIGAILRAGLLPLAFVFALGALVEGGVGTWGVLFLRSRLGVAAVVGATAYVFGQALATGARTTLGWTADRLGERRGARLGLALAAVGLLAEAMSHDAWVAGLGLAAASVGSAVYWPLLLATAGEGTERPGVIVGGVSAAGYLGFLAGPPLVGWIADGFGLRAGLGVLAIFATAAAITPLRHTTIRRATAAG
jgi:MFS family permease